MSTKKQSVGQGSVRGLGRGLDALFRNTESSAEQTGGMTPSSLSVHALIPFAGQPRTRFDEVALEELAASIKSQGVVQPLIVRLVPVGLGAVPVGVTHEIVAGERRWRAAKRAGLQMLPVIVRTLSDADAHTVALIENVQREDLNPFEEAQALQHLRDKLSISQEELATRLGKSRSAIANALRLLHLPVLMQDGLLSGGITAGHGRALLALADTALQEALFHAICERELSVRDTEAVVQYVKKHNALPSNMEGFNESTKELVDNSSDLNKSSEENSQQEKPYTDLARRGRRTKSAHIIEWQKLLRRAVHPKVNITGDIGMGRITLPYDTEEDLQHLCQLLGVEKDVSALRIENLNDIPVEKSESVLPEFNDLPDELSDELSDTLPDALPDDLSDELSDALPDEFEATFEANTGANADIVPEALVNATDDAIMPEGNVSLDGQEFDSDKLHGNDEV